MNQDLQASISPLQKLTERLNRASVCMEACAGIEDPAAAIQAARDALQMLKDTCETSPPLRWLEDVARSHEAAKTAIDLLTPKPTIN